MCRHANRHGRRHEYRRVERDVAPAFFSLQSLGACRRRSPRTRANQAVACRCVSPRPLRCCPPTRSSPHYVVLAQPSYSGWSRKASRRLKRFGIGSKSSLVSVSGTIVAPHSTLQPDTPIRHHAAFDGLRTAELGTVAAAAADAVPATTTPPTRIFTDFVHVNGCRFIAENERKQNHCAVAGTPCPG